MIAEAKTGKTSSQKSAPQPARSDSMSDWEKQVIAEAKRGKTSSQKSAPQPAVREGRTTTTSHCFIRLVSYNFTSRLVGF